VPAIGAGRCKDAPLSSVNLTPSASSTSSARDKWATIASGTALLEPSHLLRVRRESRARAARSSMERLASATSAQLITGDSDCQHGKDSAPIGKADKTNNDSHCRMRPCPWS